MEIPDQEPRLHTNTRPGVRMTEDQKTEAVTEEVLAGPIVVPDLLQAIDDQIAGKLPPPDGAIESDITAGECAEIQGII